jgi:soluble lytic murein transglycosylase-like protein
MKLFFMIKKIYKIIFFSFFIYVFLLNFFCFLTNFNPKSLINPFYISSRSISASYLISYIFFDTGIGIHRTDKKEIDSYIEKVSKKHGIDDKIIKLMVEIESKYNEFAISRTGAMGLMQIMPGTFMELGFEKPFFYKDNINAGIKYFSIQYKKFDNLSLALAAYNAGPGTVINSKGIPRFGETLYYVNRIVSKYNLIRNKE